MIFSKMNENERWIISKKNKKIWQFRKKGELK